MRQKKDSSQNLPPKPPSLGETHRRAARVLLLLLVLGFLFTVFAVGLHLQSSVSEFSSGKKSDVVSRTKSELNKNPSPTSLPLPASYDGPDKINILLVGSDSRSSEKGRADTVLLLHLDHNAHRMGVMSLPRDLRVDIPGYGKQKINAAYSYGGMPLLVATVRENFGIRINHFVIIDFKTFRSAVDAIGGLYLPIDHRYLNKNVGTSETNYSDIDLQPGYQHMDGNDILSYVRYRHTDSDLIRHARQTLFLSEFKAAWVDQQSLGTLDELISVAGEGVTSDLDRLDKVSGILWAISQVRSSNINRIELETTSVSGSYDLLASDTQRRRAIVSWLGEKAVKTKEKAPTPSQPQLAETTSSFVDMPSLDISPSCLPAKMRAEDKAEKGRAYILEASPAFALPIKASAKAGAYYLWMWTDSEAAKKLPIFQRSLSREGPYYYYKRGDRVLYMMKKVDDRNLVWIHNTLRLDLTTVELKTLLASCV